MTENQTSDATADTPSPYERQEIPGGYIYTSYSHHSNLPPADSNHTRFICNSDTHSSTFDVPDGDVLIHSGDLSRLGRLAHLQPTAKWLCSLPHRDKIVIAGNHDLTLDNGEPKCWYESCGNEFHRPPKESPTMCRELFTGQTAVSSNIHYLEYQSVLIQPKPGGKKWKIYGSPGTPWFGGWAFNYRPDQAADIYSNLPDDADIVITHGPPRNILDLTMTGVRAGCPELREKLSVVRPTLSVFAHIHEDRGVFMHQWPAEDRNSSKRGQTLFVNAANTPMGIKAADLRDRGVKPTIGGPGFQPIVVDLV